MPRKEPVLQHDRFYAAFSYASDGWRTFFLLE